MRIAIISDTHDNVPNIEKFLSWAKANQIEMIIHCGDVAAPGVIKKIFAEQFSGLMHVVHGNVSDRELLAEICGETKNIKLYGDVGVVRLPLNKGEDGRGSGNLSPSSSPLLKGGEKGAEWELQIAFCHFPDEARKLAATGDYGLVFYGHTHQPWIEKSANGCQLINPGTLGGLFQKPTFAFYDTESNNLELKILEQL